MLRIKKCLLKDKNQTLFYDCFSLIFLATKPFSETIKSLMQGRVYTTFIKVIML